MTETGEGQDITRVILTSDRFRAWIDDRSIGHVRVIKRINFCIIISAIRQIASIQKKDSENSQTIRIYIPRSLMSINSENLQVFIQFARDCGNILIEIIEIEEL
ncbi:hypothetical protein [Methanospirillum lacunae]|uniref:Uncharacterized protein n=1 Tax=Methanospirillum lacunae TaxID=668570 RepID=A0A2V2MXG8_9EURY|nr:hypothetical protein [Methanospirillum lacunae]PWR70930.1 hypothetical protein DK846_13155 [Methanospirillum lacunae]